MEIVDKRENEIAGGEPDEGDEPPEKKPRDLERWPNLLTIVIIYDNIVMDRKEGLCMTEKELWSYVKIYYSWHSYTFQHSVLQL